MTIFDATPLIGRIADRKVFVLDLDGVLYLNHTLIDKADEGVAMLKAAGYKVAFLTNNSGKSNDAVCQKLKGMGVPCEPNEVFTSADSAARYIKKYALDRTGVFCVGSPDIKKGLNEREIKTVSPQECSCILVGFKKDLCYEDAAQSIIALERGVPFLICNRDPYFPDVGGKLNPGCGYTVGAIEGSFTRKADVNVGKPEIYPLEMICEAYGADFADLVLVGDTEESDVALARKAGVPIVYVGQSERISGENVYSCASLYEFAVEMTALKADV